MEPPNNLNENPQGNQPLQPNPPVFSPHAQPTSQYPQPQQPVGYPTGQPIHQQTTPQYSPSTPVNHTTLNYGSNPSGQNKSRKKLFALILIILVIVIAGAAFALTKQDKSNTAISLSCAPSTGSTVNEATAEIEYETFANAIKQKDQACVNSLSSSYFEQTQDKIFSASNGDWTTKSVGSLPSMASRLSDLPANFNAADFKDSSYTRSSDTDQSLSTASTGSILSYEIIDNYSKTKVYMEIAFVSENNKIVVDFFNLTPAALTQDLSQ